MSSSELDREIGQKIQAAIDQAGTTQHAVAKALGVSRSLINQICLGTRPCRLGRLYAIARLLNCPPEKLLPPHFEHLSDRERVVLELLDRVGDDRFDAVLAAWKSVVDAVVGQAASTTLPPTSAPIAAPPEAQAPVAPPRRRSGRPRRVEKE